MAGEKFYSTNGRGLLISRCETTGFLIGGGECMDCCYFEGKSKKYKCVKCRKERS